MVVHFSFHILDIFYLSPWQILIILHVINMLQHWPPIVLYLIRDRCTDWHSVTYQNTKVLLEELRISLHKSGCVVTQRKSKNPKFVYIFREKKIENFVVFSISTIKLFWLTTPFHSYSPPETPYQTYST